MKWHKYPDEKPENGQVCLIKPEKTYYYADHTITTFLLDRWRDFSYGEEYDLFGVSIVAFFGRNRERVWQ